MSEVEVIESEAMRAFEAWLKSIGHRLIAKLLGTPRGYATSAGDDIADEARLRFLKAIRKNPIENPAGFASKMVRRLVTSHLSRKHKAHAQLPDSFEVAITQPYPEGNLPSPVWEVEEIMDRLCDASPGKPAETSRKWFANDFDLEITAKKYLAEKGNHSPSDEDVESAKRSVSRDKDRFFGDNVKSKLVSSRTSSGLVDLFETSIDDYYENAHNTFWENLGSFLDHPTRELGERLVNKGHEMLISSFKTTYFGDCCSQNETVLTTSLYHLMSPQMQKDHEENLSVFYRDCYEYHRYLNLYSPFPDNKLPVIQEKLSELKERCFKFINSTYIHK